MRRTIGILAAATAVAGALTWIAAVPGAGAEPPVPVPGAWHAITAAGLPVRFAVAEGEVTELSFRFRWGWCGIPTFTAEWPAPIDSGDHWRVDPGTGWYIDATFVAPDRAEGVVVTRARSTPSCPQTTARFVAEPGTAPFTDAEVVVRVPVGGHRYLEKPRTMVIRHDGVLRLEGLRWHGWGQEVTTAGGRAVVGGGGVVRRPRVSVELEGLVAGRGGRQVYQVFSYGLSGPLPPDVPRQGQIALARYARG